MIAHNFEATLNYTSGAPTSASYLGTRMAYSHRNKALTDCQMKGLDEI